MPSISVGQADNLLSAGSVSMPSYTNGSLTRKDYPCSYSPNLSIRPVPIPLGTYDPKNEFQRYRNAVPWRDNGSQQPDQLVYAQPRMQENYEDMTQHYNAGEFSDRTILAITLALLFSLIICTYMSFKM